MVKPVERKSITVKSGGMVQTFTGDPQLHLLSIGVYFISIHDPSAPSGRRTAWQQRVENGRAEGFEITMEGFDMGLKVGDRVRNRSGWEGVVSEVTDTDAKVEFDNGQSGWFGLYEHLVSGGVLELI
ncbi:hypothetical protein A5773_04210 [Mycobacterium sp. 852014-52450_SCH5900713]|uniref:hypothetical protein n=1 Tax=Mycobacterium sp. 852014-52450_SCH5900713 TaxID=1834116 RepID=UPI0008009871|nr:hypothetical protein [Mycobacterium sp. 852014-52450_SCH5900713]OBG00698.1 hypothetical protein A5773_04210 [Mycobacterium sp. 852014-52450_SCH5900713]